jgi:DNA-binding transcriptional regulator YdaS (Cro superfamily)
MKQNLTQYLEPRGRRAALARRLKITHAAVRQWDLRRIPALRVLAVERLTGISRHSLRPDLYPRGRKAG